MNATKIILTRCQIFNLKRTKFNFGWEGNSSFVKNEGYGTPVQKVGVPVPLVPRKLRLRYCCL